MKKILASCTLLTAIMLIAPQTFAAPKLDKYTEANLIKVCEALRGNNKLKLHLAVKRTGVRYHHLAKGLVCNGQDAVTFALSHNANKTAALFAKRASVDINTMLAKH